MASCYSSMEVIVDVSVENTTTGAKTKSNEAILTFVAIDQNGSPLPVPPLEPETEDEKKFNQDLATLGQTRALVVH